MEGVNIRRQFTIGQTERRVLRGQAVAANDPRSVAFMS